MSGLPSAHHNGFPPGPDPTQQQQPFAFSGFLVDSSALNRYIPPNRRSKHAQAAAPAISFESSAGERHARPVKRLASGGRARCTYFEAGRCGNRDSCTHPHLLPDGSDARELGRGRPQQRGWLDCGVNRACAGCDGGGARASTARLVRGELDRKDPSLWHA